MGVFLRRSGALVGLPLSLVVGLVILPGAPAPRKQPYTAWSAYGGTSDSMQYSALTQINKTNVNQLEQVWFYPIPTRAELAFSPLIVGNVMYVAGDGNRSVVALDAATGKVVWTHPTEGAANERGYTYWASKDGSDRRILFSVNNRLQEVDAATGTSIKTFGKDGLVDLREDLDRDPKTIRRISSRSPGQVFENLIIQGSLTGEGYDDPPGWLRAYDVLTGKLVWTFHTVPLPGEFGHDTWPPDAYKFTGGTNTWSNFSVDEKRGIGYFPLGSPTNDFYGGRRTGRGLFGNCILALDLRTGKRLWHFQVVHHDLWDLDLCTEPILLTVRHNGKMVDIVAVASKSGLLFVFNRVTGEPLWPIEERPVPTKTDVPGEEVWPTQPFPTVLAPISRQTLSEKDVNPYLDPAEFEAVRDVIRASRYEGPYTPLMLGQDQISFPGEYGGTNWGGNAGDPATGVYYVREENTPLMHRLTEWTGNQRPPAGGTPEQQGHALWTRFCESCHSVGEHGIDSLKSSPERIRALVREGNGPMPAVKPSELNEQGMTQLLAYIANPAAGARQAAPPTPAQSAAPRPLPNGEAHRYSTGPTMRTRFGTKEILTGLPAISPPWSNLVAYDLNDGSVKFRVPLGTVPELAARGITNTGSYHPDRNGMAVTAGGLVFIGTLGDATFRAFDKDNGKVLWERKMESNPEGLPAVYEVGGREYLAFFLHTHGEPSTAGPGKPEAQGYYVFALPEKTAVSKK
jgi:quinoprotein glucose dehydrogenase